MTDVLEAYGLGGHDPKTTPQARSAASEERSSSPSFVDPSTLTDLLATARHQEASSGQGGARFLPESRRNQSGDFVRTLYLSGVVVGPELVTAPSFVIDAERIEVVPAEGPTLLGIPVVLDEPTGLALLIVRGLTLRPIRPSTVTPAPGTWVVSSAGFGPRPASLTLGRMQGVLDDPTHYRATMLQIDQRPAETAAGGGVVSANAKLVGVVMAGADIDQRQGYLTTLAVPGRHVARLLRLVDRHRPASSPIPATPPVSTQAVTPDRPVPPVWIGELAPPTTTLSESQLWPSLEAASSETDQWSALVKPSFDWESTPMPGSSGRAARSVEPRAELPSRHAATSDSEVGPLDESLIVVSRRRPRAGIILDGRPDSILVAEVFPDSPASDAGLAVGDILVEAEGEPVSSVRQMLSMLVSRLPGDTLRLTLLRPTALGPAWAHDVARPEPEHFSTVLILGGENVYPRAEGLSTLNQPFEHAIRPSQPTRSER